MAVTPVAIVTGGAQGIGAAICVVLLKQGYKVCVADLNEEKGREFVSEQQQEFGKDRVIFSLCDVSKESHYEATFELTLKTFQQVNVLINNAGICLEQDPTTTIAVNLLGPIYGCQTAIRYMGKNKGGHGGIVISTASIAGFLPIYKCPSYTASKHGIIGLTRSYGHSYHLEKEGIIFAAICPSFTDTDIMKSARNNVLDPDPNAPLYPNLMSPVYVAQAVLKILEDRMNGSTLLITEENGYQYIGVQEELKEITMASSK